MHCVQNEHGETLDIVTSSRLIYPDTAAAPGSWGGAGGAERRGEFHTEAGLGRQGTGARTRQKVIRIAS